MRCKRCCRMLHVNTMEESERFMFRMTCLKFLQFQNTFAVLFILFGVYFGCVTCAEQLQAPRFNMQPSSTSSIVSEGRTKILQCSALGIPQPTYRWLRDGQPLGEYSSEVFYKVLNTRRADAGAYQCIARNDVGAIFSEKNHVTVAYMGIFEDGAEQTVSVESGRAAVLELPTIESYPRPSVNWQDEFGPLRYDHKYAVSRNHQLIILACSKEDEKAYRARAINTQLGKEENSPFIKLKVIEDNNKEVLPEIIIKPEDIRIVKGQEVTELQCIANARPLHELETLWFKDGILIDMAGVSYDLNDPWNRTLGLISANLTHTGQYQCQVKLKTGGSPTVTAEATVTVQEKPIFLSTLRLETLAAFGSTVTLNCDVQGVPTPSITWYRDGKTIGSTGGIHNDVNVSEFDNGNGRYLVEEDRSLRIENVRIEDMGIFQCIAANDAGEASIHTWLKIKTSAPVLLSSPANATLLDGADATLACRATGAPKPNVTWYLNDTLLTNNDNRGRVQTLEEGDLLVTGTTPGDSGKYTCVQVNDAGQVTGQAYLTVLVGTKVLSPPVDTRVLLGHTASLQCKVASDQNVPFNIDWLHNDQVVVGGSRVWVSAEGSLEVSAARATDAGTYACVVTSPGGNHTRRATLAVVELPFAPTNVRAAPALASPDPPLPSKTSHPPLPPRAVNLSWTPGFDGNSPLIKFIVQKREVPEFGPVPDPLLNWVTELHNVSRTVRWVLLTNLKAATAYQFRVSAVNSVGEGSPSDPTDILILPQEAPSGPPIGFVGSARSSSEIITQWQPPLEEHRNGHILGYVIRYRLFGYNHSPWTDRNITNEAQRNFLIQDLITWKDYVVQIAAYNDKGVGVFTEGAKIKTKEGVPEAPPVNVTSEAFNSTAVTIRWTPPDPQKINGINQGYKIQAWRWDEGEHVEHVEQSVPPNVLDPLAPQSVVLAGLRKYTCYNVSVLCFTHPGDGQRSPFVSVRTHMDVPDEVGSLQFDEVSDRALKVIWSPPKQVNGVLLGYKLQYEIKDKPDTVKEEVVLPNITSIRVENLLAMTQYKFWVSALTEVGAGEARAATIQSGVEPVLPHAPHNLALSNIHAKSVLLQFTPGFDGNSSISKWIVEAQTARNSSWITIFELTAPDAQSIVVPSLVPFTTYRLRVIASNVVGLSPPSEPCKEFQTLQAPPKHAPHNVTVRAVSATDLRVRWIPLQQSEWYGNPRGYNISYRFAGVDEDAGHEGHKDHAGYEGYALIDDHTANSHILAGLEEWTPYEIRVTALNEVGSSQQSSTAIERTREAVPSEGPTCVSANATSSTTVVVTWGSVAARHRNGLVEGYKVCYVGEGEAEGGRQHCRAVPNNRSRTLTLTELRKHVTYEVRVLAYTRLGDGHLSHPPATVTTHQDTPGAPSNVSFPDVTFTTARIIWDVPEHPNGEILAYRVTYNLNSTTEHIYSREFLPSDRTFRALELISDSYYLFTVTAQTRLGWGAVARALVFTTANRATPQAPSPPRVSLGQLQAHHITFSWTPGRDGFAPLRYYTIQQKEDGATWKSIPERVDPFSTSYTASELTPFTLYQFRIRATNDIGPSRFSNSSNTVQTLPAAPSKSVDGVRVVPITTNSVSVSWHAMDRQHWSGDTDTAGYRILYQPVSDFPAALNSPSKEQVMGIKSDRVILTSLSVDRNYEIAVVGFNAQGAGPRGAPVTVWVGEAVPTASPSNVRAEALSPSEVLLHWQAPAHSQQNGDLLGYKIFYLMTESPEELDPDKKIEEELEVVPATWSSHSLVFLDKYTQYRVQMLAFNPAGDGPRSTPVSVTTLQGLPGPPRNIRFSDISMTAMTITWDAPQNKNGIIVGYIVTYETTQQDEKFSKQVKQKVSSRRLVLSGLEEEVEYSVWVRALTLDAGPALQASVRTGPQDGSPAAPRALRLARGPAALELRWDNAPSGKGPLLGYYVETRKKDNTRWETVTRTSNGHLEELTISYQSLLPSTAYWFRVISYNAFGISCPAYCEDVIVTPSKLYLEYGYLQYRPFYRQTWFMVALAAVSLVIIIMLISVLCVKSKTHKYKQEAQKTLEESLAMDSECRGSLAMELYRARQGEGQGSCVSAPARSRARLASLGKSPPRPSPASVAYHSDEESLRDYDENPDDSSVTEKPSELSSSDSQNSESENESIRSDPHSFVNHYANVNDSLRQSWKRQKPVRNYSSYTDSEPEGSAVVSLNGGQIIMNNMARSRAPLPGFSSFV